MLVCGRHARPVGEPADQSRDRRDVADAETSPADNAVTRLNRQCPSDQVSAAVLHGQARPLDQIDLRKADNDALLSPFDPALLLWRSTARWPDVIFASLKNLREQIIHSGHVVLTMKVVVVN